MNSKTTEIRRSVAALGYTFSVHFGILKEADGIPKPH